jgi:hypothetical protein
MNFYGEYLDIPVIPSNLIPSAEEILAFPEREYPSNIQKHRAYYQGRHQIKKVSPELKEWLKQNFPFDIFAYYSVYPLLIAPHVDIRPVAYNYFIDTGGEIDTVFYNKIPNTKKDALWNSVNPNNTKYDTLNEEEPLREIARMRFDSHRWLKLQTDIPHGTEGNMIRPRIFITVTKTFDIPVSNSPVSDALQEMVTNW